MKNIFLLLSFLLIAITAIAQRDLTLTTAPWVGDIPEATLIDGMEMEGKYITGASWEDMGGINYFLVSEVTHEKELKNDLHVYQYIYNGGEVKLVWSIRDFSQPLSNVHIVENSLQVLDLDGDGFMETSFLYHFPSDGADPTELKLMLHSKGEKLAIRGSIPVMEDEMPVMNIDPVVKKYPKYFENFMVSEWNEYRANAGDYIEWAKHMHTTGPGYRIMEYWYNLASGGMAYKLLDDEGKSMELPGNRQMQLMQSEDLLSLGDGFRFVYANLPKLGIINLKTKAGADLVTFYETTEGISPLVLSPSGKKVAYFALNPSYPEGTKLFVLTLEGEKVVKKQKFDVPTFRMAASAWVIEPPSFMTENIIEYLHWTNPGDEGVRKTVKIE